MTTPSCPACADLEAPLYSMETQCPVCGRQVTPLVDVIEAVGEVVEPDTAAAQPSESERQMLESNPAWGALAAAPRLMALAWRQPAVRSAVTTGAGAVALSILWRMAGAAVARRRDASTLLPEGASLLADAGDLLREATPSKRWRKRGRRGAVVHEVVYMRRVTYR